MKRLFKYIFLLPLLLVVSCVYTEGLEKDEILTVSQTTFEFSCEESSSEFTIQSYCGWKIKCEADWVTFSNYEDNSNVIKNILGVSENNSVEARFAQAEIYNTRYGINYKLAISQQSGDPYIKSSIDSIQVSIEGTNEEITLESNISWSASCSRDWVQITPVSGEAGESTLNIVVAENIVVEPREAIVSITNSEYGITKEITVSQVAFEPEMKLSREKLENISYNGSIANITITIESNISWSVSCSSDWVTFSPSSGDAGESALNIVVAENILVEPREAVITIVNTEYGITKEITVSQVAFVPELKLSREKLENISCNGSAENIIIESNVSWSASCLSEWVQITPLSGGKGGTSMVVEIQENSVEESREAEILVVNEEYSIVKKVVVSQNKWTPNINGHEYVDLGLPSGLKWATCNVGASSPEDYGDYYAWGEVVTKDEYNSGNCVTYGKSMSDISSNPTYDVARKKWGGSWRLPTKEEFWELIRECEWKWQWTTQNGKKGYKVTGPNGNSIFLPAAGCRYGSSLSGAGEYGYFWSSTPDESNDDNAYLLIFFSSNQNVYWYSRHGGRSVRPVSE